MSSSRHIIKKIVFKVFGERFYARAYAKGKIKDINQGVLDEAEAAFLPLFIKTDSTVLDIGANYGHYAVEMAKICPTGKVYAFEPVPFTFTVLNKVLSHFKLSQISSYHTAVSDANGEIEMTIPLLDFGAPNTGIAFIGASENGNSKKVSVKTLKLDDFQIDGRIDFIKIDIEGHEPQAFLGMKAIIEKHQPVILIEFSYSCLKRANTNPEEFAKQLIGEYNYRFAKVEADILKWDENEIPLDGYYFLIPVSKTEQFNIEG